MPLAEPANASQTRGPTEQAEAPARPEIDLKALAQKIYKLLKEEARLERERLGRPRTR
jgi:hypothetical protein